MNKLYIISLFILASLSAVAQTKLPATVTKSSTSVNVIKVVSGGTDDVIVIDNTGGGSDDTPSDTHEYVDLGLSVKWANCNVGAENPEDYGDYFAWGETKGYNSGKTTFGWSNYSLCNGTSKTQTKYCISSSYGTVDNKTVLESSDDAATANWGSNWRMPTEAELYELITDCYWEWTSDYKSTGTDGFIIYKVKTDSDKGVKKFTGTTIKPEGSYTTSDTHIFLPAAGFRDEELSFDGHYGYYWTSSVHDKYLYSAYELYFHSSKVVRTNSLGRCYGQSVRPVCQ